MAQKQHKHSLVWFRNDLRVTDNPALHHACKTSEQVSAVFLIADKTWQAHKLSERRVQLTLSAVEQLQTALAQLGIPLSVKQTSTFNNAAQEIQQQIARTNCDAVFCNYEYALDELNRDRAVQQLCESTGVTFYRSNAQVVIPPGKVLTQNGEPFKVFTPFKRTWLQQLGDYDRTPFAKPKPQGKALQPQPLQLVTNPELIANHPATEAAASKRLRHFVKKHLDHYHEQRDIPAQPGTSQLSAYFAIGLLSPHSALQAVRQHNEGELVGGHPGSDTWVNELIWREFYIHLLAANPKISRRQPLKPETDQVAWRYDQQEFADWCQGKTGYPLVDAAMRQLNTTGWMHNRLRMVTATFLTKYLLIDWRWGEDYFMSQLIDGHFAANNGGWQWCASTGTDAAPYFRILQPVRQAERFDPEARFIKHYLPELADLPANIINKPGHRDLLATGYPAPIVDLKFGRERCLAAFKAAR